VFVQQNAIHKVVTSTVSADYKPIAVFPGIVKTYFFTVRLWRLVKSLVWKRKRKAVMQRLHQYFDLSAWSQTLLWHAVYNY